MSGFKCVVLALLGIAAAVATSAAAQQLSSEHPANLTLRLEVGSTSHGLPESLNFVLTNIGKHDLRLPRPTVNCGDSYDGSVWLWVQTPVPPRYGVGCSSSKYEWPPLLDRIKPWQTLRPGESLHIEVKADQLHFDGTHPGKYEFYAIYEPPSLSPDEQAALQKAGIGFPETGDPSSVDYPQGKLTSASLIFTRKP